MATSAAVAAATAAAAAAAADRRRRNGRRRFAELHVFGLHGMHVLVSAARADRAMLERVVRGLRMVDDPDRPSSWTDQPLP